MQILKLFYNHDLRLDTLAKRNANKTEEEVEATLQDFMKPTPTYSKFYLTATDLEGERFGLNVLESLEDLLDGLDDALGAASYRTHRARADCLSDLLEQAETGEAILITPLKAAPDREIPDAQLSAVNLEADSNVGHHKEELRDMLLAGHRVLYKEQAHHGYDLHLFSSDNLYADLFPVFRSRISDSLRLFSINSKRMRSERHFYFETWSLDQPPHGAEEVFPDTQI
ncbi:MAG: hypothetical protein U5K31_01360 [Balneolaceae bacterium]|nr:hypothetical protein [Balneolaceae bacterium]